MTRPRPRHEHHGALPEGCLLVQKPFTAEGLAHHVRKALGRVADA